MPALCGPQLSSPTKRGGFGLSDQMPEVTDNETDLKDQMEERKGENRHHSGLMDTKMMLFYVLYRSFFIGTL